MITTCHYRRIYLSVAIILLVSSCCAHGAMSPVFRVGGLHAEYDGAAYSFNVIGAGSPLFWRPIGESDFSLYGANVSFTLTANHFEVNDVNAGLIGSRNVSLQIVDENTGVTLLTALSDVPQTIGYMSCIKPFTPVYPEPGLFALNPKGGSLSAGRPFILAWAEGTHLNPEFDGWNTNYSGDVEAWFYWTVPEPATASFVVLAILIASKRVRA